MVPVCGDQTSVSGARVPGHCHHLTVRDNGVSGEVKNINFTKLTPGKNLMRKLVLIWNLETFHT